MKRQKKMKIAMAVIAEIADGKISGGFEILQAGHLLVAIGGDETNNCKGGNCVSGCTEINTVSGCGGNLNIVAGCGVN